MKKLLFLFSISLFLLVSCTNKRDKITKDIQQKESKLFSGGNAYNLKTPEVQCLIDKYELFANTFPDDTASAGYLYKSADLYIGIKNYKAAAKSYEKVIHDYPKYSKMSYCIFLAGFNAENNLHDIEMAKKYYTLFLQNYPNASMANDVQFSLQNLGRSADDIVKEFEEKLKLQDSLKTL
jgi:outer membrane protein assembly factor BamD (BamD/ComL family)